MPEIYGATQPVPSPARRLETASVRSAVDGAGEDAVGHGDGHVRGLPALDYVVFDLGRVILKPPATLQPLSQRLRVRADTSDAEFRAAYFAPRSDYDRTSDDANYWAAVAAQLGAPAPTARDIAELTKLDTAAWCQPEPGTLAVVHELAAAEMGLAVLSNAPHSVGEHIRSLPWSALFDTIVISGEIDMLKPEPQIYRYLLSLLGAPADRVAFTDDLPGNIAGADAVGIRGIPFVDASSLRRDLVEFGVLLETD